MDGPHHPNPPPFTTFLLLLLFSAHPFQLRLCRCDARVLEPMGHLGLSYIIRCVYVFLIDLGTNELSDTRRARRGGRHYALWQADLGEEEEKQGLCWVVRGCACWRLETTGRRGVRPLSGVCGWWAGGDRHTPPPVPAHLPLPLPTGVTSAAILRPTFPSPLGFTGPPAGRSISVSACVVRLCRLLSEASTLLSSPKKKIHCKG